MPATTPGASEYLPHYPLDRGQRVIDVTHPDFGAPSGGATNATAAIQDALTNANGQYVLVPRKTGGFLVTGLTLGTAKGLILEGTLKTNTNAPVISVTANDQEIVGTGAIQSLGSAGGSQIGVLSDGFDQFRFERFRVYALDVGIKIKNSFGGVGILHDGGRVFGVNAYNCVSDGFLTDARGEYVSFAACNAHANARGFHILGGNALLTGCNSNDNTTGIMLDPTLNDAHGIAVGCNFNHNLSYAVLANAITFGFDFSGCHMYGGNVTLSGAQDVSFIGGHYSIANWICNSGARGRVLDAIVDADSGDVLNLSADSYFYFNERCTRPGGVALPVARMRRGGYVTANRGSNQSIPNGAITTILWQPVTQETAGNSTQTAFTFLVGATGVFTNRGLGGGGVDFRLLAKCLNPGASPTNTWMNIKKNGLNVHPYIAPGRVNTGGVEYAMFAYNGRIQADVGDTITFEIENYTGSAMTVQTGESFLVAEGL